MALTKAPDIAEAEPPLPPTSQPKGRWVTPAGGRQLPRWGPEMRACLHHFASLWEGTRGREAAKPRKKHGHSQELTTAPQLPARGPGTQSGWGPRAARSAGRPDAGRRGGAPGTQSHLPSADRSGRRSSNTAARSGHLENLEQMSMPRPHPRPDNQNLSGVGDRC